MRLWIILFSLLLGGPAWAQTTAALSVKGNVVQGNPLFISVVGQPESAGEVHWAGQTFRVGRSDRQGRLRAVLPVPVDGPTGAQSMTVKLGDEEVQRSFTISPRSFPLQRLWINANTLASYDNPQNRADDEAILKVARQPDSILHWSGNFKYPIQAPETTGFGDRRVYNGWKKSWHKGLDLGGWEGQGVHAPAAGTVVHTARGLVNGNTIVISHGLGLTTEYYHLQSIDVSEGEPVEAGQVIGKVGGTGGFSPHLHWEARVWGVPIDPKSLFQLPEGWR
jgi:murein DD-endopeptidase MepM/ murein hydrolase activator NlpD